MNKPAAAQVAWAKRLPAAEGNSGDKADECAAAAWRVYEMLNTRLSPLLRSAGVQALCVRSATLAQMEFASLAEITTPDGLTKLRASQELREYDITSASGRKASSGL
jgi:hypothetical protein